MRRILYITACLMTCAFPDRVSAGCNAANANNGTLEVRKNSQLLTANQIIYITSAPAMPTLTAKLTGSPSGTLNWTLSQEFIRGNLSNDPDYTKANASATATWNINSSIGTHFFGGKITVSLEDPAGETCEFVFHIRGTNPAENTVKTYIGTSPWYAIPIAKQESNFLQFNTGQASINNLIRACPNKGPGNDWGIFQLNNPAPSNTQVWNWKANVDRGKTLLTSKAGIAQAYFDAVARTYPNQYEAPPTHTPSGCSTTMSALDAATIQLYNGAAVKVDLQNVYGNTERYLSCWSFDSTKPSGQRWTFVSNNNDYVMEVTKKYENL